MLILAKNPSYSWPVEISLPVEGKHEKHTFTCVFKRLPQSRLKELLSEESTVKDLDFCREIVLGWKDVRDENGQEIPFSELALVELLEIPMMAKAVVEAYLGSLREAKEKN